MKESGLRIRIDKVLRKDFLAACRAQDQTGSQVLRAFMRDYVDRVNAAQHDLFQGQLSPKNSDD